MTKKAWKPEGYPSASPYLVVDGAGALIEWAKAAFGAVELRRYDMPDGKVAHAEFRIDDSVIMVADGGHTPPFPSLLHVYVPDVDATFARALEAGGVALHTPGTRPGDPDKRGSFKDPWGNTWSISTQL